MITPTDLFRKSYEVAERLLKDAPEDEVLFIDIPGDKGLRNGVRVPVTPAQLRKLFSDYNKGAEGTNCPRCGEAI